MRLVPLAPVLVLCAGCVSYPERTRGAFHDFQRGHFQRAIEAYGDTDYVGSVFLSGVEAGTVSLAAGDWEGALLHFGRAAAASEEVEGRALIGTERLGELVSSWALNDAQTAYHGEGFERVYLHASLAVAYLALGELESVGVEVRLANRLLEVEEELYDERYAAGGFAHLVSALAYELSGELDQAYIDYERMISKGLGTEIAGPALARISRELGRTEELQRWVERFGEAPAHQPDAAIVVCLAGVGLGPHKVEASLALPTHDGVLTFASPAYLERPQSVGALRLRAVELGATVRTALVESVAEVARKNLEDRLLWTAGKSVARGILKRELTKQLEDEFGLGGRVAGDLFALLSERADLRAWQTLPDSWQAARMFVPPGIHTFELEAIGGEARALGSVELEPGETLVILARSVGSRLHAYPIGGRPVSDVPGEGIGEGAALLDVP